MLAPAVAGVPAVPEDAALSPPQFTSNKATAKVAGTAKMEEESFMVYDEASEMGTIASVSVESTA